MASFKEMDPEKIRELLKGHADILGPLAQKEEQVFRNLTCPNCRSGDLESSVNASRPFSKGSPLPNKILKCLRCSSELDPYSGILLKVPTGG